MYSVEVCKNFPLHGALSLIYKCIIFSRSVVINIPSIILLYTLTCFLGLTVYAFYESIGCDPLEGGFVENPNQVIYYSGIIHIHKKLFHVLNNPRSFNQDGIIFCLYSCCPDLWWMWLDTLVSQAYSLLFSLVEPWGKWCIIHIICTFLSFILFVSFSPNTAPCHHH